MRLRTVLDSLGNALSWHRRAVAAVIAAVGMFVGLQAASPSDDPRVRVVVAVHGLEAGHRLEETDLTTVDFDTGLAPEGSVTSIADAVGRTLVGPLTARSVVTSASLAQSGGLVAQGRVAAPLSIREASVRQMIRVGSRVTVFGSNGVIVRDARVAALPEAPASGGIGLSASETVALVDVTPEEASALAKAAGFGEITIALR